MGLFAFDIYAYNAPNGSALVRLTPSKAVTLAFRQPAVGFGMSDGQITIHSDHADATAANFHRHNLVKVVWVPDSGPEVKVGAFFLEEGDFTALSTREQGGRMLSFHGPNTWYYLERAILRERGYTTESIPWPTRRGGRDTPGYWTWGADADGREPGPIMVRVLEEGRDQPENPLGDATWDFDRTNDSASNAWDATGDTWQVQIGTTMLDMAIMFVRSGNFWFRAGPDLNYSAYNADPGVDRTSATFAADKVRFAAGVNIVTEVRRKISASVDRSALLVTGSLVDVEEEADRFVFVDGGSSSVPWIGHTDAGEVAGVDRLEAMGTHELLQRSVRSEEAIPLQHIVADDELNGGYIPFIHYEPGDTVTIHTGTDDHDFNNFGIVVAAVRILHDDAGNWFGVPELGEQVQSADTKAFEERASLVCCGPRPPTPATPPGAGTPDTVVHSWTFASDNLCDCHGTVGWIKGVHGTAWTSSDGGIAQTGGVGDGGQLAADVFAASAGTEYRVVARQRNRWGLNPTDGVVLKMEFLSSVGGNLATHIASPAAVSINSWVSVSVQATAPANTTQIRLSAARGPTGGSSALHHDLDDIYVTEVGSGTPGDPAVPGDGNDETIGTQTGTYALVDHDHTYVRDTAPSLTDDEDSGFLNEQFWLHVDDVNDPTEVLGLYVLMDNTAGAAVWVQAAAATGHTHDDNPDVADVVSHGSMGATETFDFTDGSDHEGTLDANLTVTLDGATDGEAAFMTLVLTQDGSGGHSIDLPSSVVNAADIETAFDDEPNAVNVLTVFSYDGGTTWYAFLAGGTAGGGSTATSWIVDPGAPAYSGSGPVTVALTSKFGIDSGGNPYYNAADVTDGEEAALVWDSVTGTYSLRPYYP